ncbi:MAG: Rrf2 family transcriptional regulator [Candidatus Omnitrophota bacterium]
MKLITRDTDYAVRALCYIFKYKNKVISVSDLVRELRIPRSFLRKILQKLNKKKILESFKGQRGGFLAAKPADQIFLVDLIETFQGKVSLNECFFRKLICPHMRACILRKKLNKIEKQMLRELKRITVASLLR